jgi:hypothetical protein
MFSFVQKRIAFVEALIDLVVHSEDNRTLFPITHLNGILFGLFSTFDYTINTLHPINTFFNLEHKIKIDNFIKYNPYTYQVFNENIILIPYLIIKLQRAWKKWILVNRKNKIDPLKRDLMEYLYHPSRLSFDPDD